MSNASITDWITAASSLLTAVVAVAAGGIGIKTFWHQRTAHDVGMAVQIFMEINRYWDRLCEPGCDYKYNIGQVLSYFEIACGLFNRNTLTKDAPNILGDHILEVFTSIQTSPHGKELLDSCRSSPTTFAELRKFADKRFPQALVVQAFSDRNNLSHEVKS